MRLLAGSVALAILATATAANANPLLALDFGLAGTNLAEPGFQPYLVSNPGTAGQLTQTFSGITVSFAGTTVGGRDRGGIFESGAFTYSDLLRDLLTALNETSTGTTLQISGLQANTAYDLQVWSLDKGFNEGSVYSWYDTTSTPVLVGQITNHTSPVLPDNNAFSITFRSTSDGSGAIRLGHSDPMGNGTINALTISAVPEPGTIALLGGAVASILTRRRR